MLNTLTIRKSLNKAFLKVKPNRSEINHFKKELRQLFQSINPGEHEEFNKNLLADFLKNTAFAPSHFINTKGRNDLVIHHNKTAKSNVGVIIETKRPNNTSEMPTKDRLNTKAVQELVLYYLRERIMEGNDKVKHLIVTDAQQWFIFDEQAFYKHFGSDKSLIKAFQEFERGTASSKNTDYFYKNIAAPAIEKAQAHIEFTHFDIRGFRKVALSNNPKLDKKLIPLFKILSPAHLLKQPFTNDSNTLDKRFYNELLHIIGLQEVGKSKKTIERLPKGKRHNGSLLENTIEKLDSSNKVRRLPNIQQYGKTYTEQLEAVALELVITWVNRILFLKLLEAQLLSYHKGNTDYAFLNAEKLRDYDEVEVLFFEVLAKQVQDRSDYNNQTFGNVPYLNSSLFEPTALENATIEISGLRDRYTLRLHNATVLKDQNGKRRTGEQNTLHYLLAFLDAYDFASEGTEDIQEQQKSIINAAVLGLIFEKINGYKDGSFFTPGFITMYMCRETLRRAVVQKFNDTKGWNCQNLDDVYDKIDDRNQANAIINSLKICDPAVGSGHFLVSALNEIIAIKADLRILQDLEGKRVKEYRFEVINDELVVTDEDEDTLFEYNPNSRESQHVQQMLFTEKQTIIENCLFGVDINPNSVKICRLRLWIELLKNAYYKPDSEHPNGRSLETLPNIDINIKCGNSLISRFALDADLKKALKKHKYSIDSYRVAVATYRSAQNKEQKWEMRQLIDTIKKDFRTSISQSSKEHRQLAKLGEELYYKYTSNSLFAEKLTSKQKKHKTQLETKISKLKSKINDIENNLIYQNAFEWRFEFPEVLDDDGHFVGFDVVIGNPPYIRQEEFKEIKDYLKTNYKTFAGTADLLVYFIEKGMTILNQQSHFTFIISNKFMRASFGKALRNWLAQYNLTELLDFGDLPVFEEATTYPCILSLQKTTPSETFNAATLDRLPKDDFDEYIENTKFESMQVYLTADSWNLANKATQLLLEKLKNQGVPLGEYVHGKIYYGVKTGYNKAFVIDEATKNELIAKDTKSEKIIKPFLAGRDIKRYQEPKVSNYLILFPKGWTIEHFGKIPEREAFEKLESKFPAIANHLAPHQTKCKKRTDKGDYWWELRACDYYDEFEKVKIIYPNILKQPEFVLDFQQKYTNQKCFILGTEDKYLLGILNSKITHFFFENVLPKLRGNFYEPSTTYFKHFPVKVAKVEQQQPIIEKVQAILNLRASEVSDTSCLTSRQVSDTLALALTLVLDLEREIDQLVYQLYGLTNEEIAIVETTVSGI